MKKNGKVVCPKCGAEMKQSMPLQCELQGKSEMENDGNIHAQHYSLSTHIYMPE